MKYEDVKDYFEPPAADQFQETIHQVIDRLHITAETIHIGNCQSIDPGGTWSECHHKFSVTLTLNDKETITQFYHCNPAVHIEGGAVTNKAMDTAETLTGLRFVGNTYASNPIGGYRSGPKVKPTKKVKYPVRWKYGHREKAGRTYVTETVNDKIFAHAAALMYKVPAADFLDCLRCDAAGTDESFKDWAESLGYETDSIAARQIYDTCQNTATDLAHFLGPVEYNNLVYIVEGL